MFAILAEFQAMQQGRKRIIILEAEEILLEELYGESPSLLWSATHRNIITKHVLFFLIRIHTLSSEDINKTLRGGIKRRKYLSICVHGNITLSFSEYHQSRLTSVY